ncbi:MAG: S41 family peptidase [Armatimonadetes bacterium]|nr:S41 family peptidase [Armatimonadota bacterium]
MSFIGKSLTWVILVGAGMTGGYFGKDFTKGDFSLEGSKYLANAGPTAPKSTPAETFTHSFQAIIQDYPQPVDAKELKYAAMQGLTSALGDPHTVFMYPEVAESFTKETRGQNEFVGVGARLQPDPQGAKLMTVFRNAPAEKAGLKPGDIVVEVDGKNVGGTPVEQIIKKIRGTAGTKVTLGISRAGSASTLRFDIKRAAVAAPTADGFLLDGPGAGLGYAAVYQFSQNTPEQFDQLLSTFDAKGIKGLVIDLRGNPGGLLEAANLMLSRFISNKLVVTMKRRDGEEQTVKSYIDMKGERQYPIAILVNSDSASASEIFSGVMRDYRIATLVGEHTYGKASVQNMYPLPDGSSVKITIAKYFLPSGKDIMRKVNEYGEYVSGGIQPDVEIPLNLGPKTQMGDILHDNQLQRAVEIIKSKL